HAIVEELAAFGAIVHTCSRTETELNDCLLEWMAKGLRVTGSVRVVSNQAQRENLLNTVSSEFNGKLNILAYLNLSITRALIFKLDLVI
ncbi:hypothetical protein Gohar_001813, partial [Gossypium harknessii]|nr:hypothetical protein [Gossypium harknessii]